MDELDPPNNFIDNECRTLQILTVVFSTIGIALSSLALCLLILTAILFKQWRESYKNQLLIQFMLARFFYTTARYVMELNGAFDLFEVGPIFSSINLFVWSYTANAQLAWIYVFTRQIYNTLGKVFYAKKHHIWRTSSLAWMLPVPVTVVLTATFQMNPINIRVYEVYLIIIKWPLLVVIAVTLALTLKAILTSNMSKPENNPRIKALMIILIFNFCGQEFIVDLFMIYILRSLRAEDVPSFLRTIIVVYNIIALYHCAMTIMFWLFGNSQTRKLWRFEKIQGVKPFSLAPQNSVERRNSESK